MAGAWTGAGAMAAFGQLALGCAEAGPGGEEVSYGIGGEVEAEGLETLGEPGGAGLLGKGRRGNGGDGELEVGDFALVAGEPVKEPVDAWVGGEAVDLLGERTGREYARTSIGSRDEMAFQK